MAEATTLHLGKLKGAGKVTTVVGETKDRESLFAAMARGELWALSSVGTLTEGVDIPCASVGAMLRFTLSRHCTPRSWAASSGRRRTSPTR
jgi:superfamily II DNA or RNA helicase